MPASLKKFLPFLRWFPLKGDTLRADFMAGITVALVLIPQSMAYAQCRSIHHKNLRQIFGLHHPDLHSE